MQLSAPLGLTRSAATTSGTRSTSVSDNLLVALTTRSSTWIPIAKLSLEMVRRWKKAVAGPTCGMHLHQSVKNSPSLSSNSGLDSDSGSESGMPLAASVLSSSPISSPRSCSPFSGNSGNDSSMIQCDLLSPQNSCILRITQLVLVPLSRLRLGEFPLENRISLPRGRPKKTKSFFFLFLFFFFFFFSPSNLELCWLKRC